MYMYVHVCICMYMYVYVCTWSLYIVGVDFLGFDLTDEGSSNGYSNLKFCGSELNLTELVLRSMIYNVIANLKEWNTLS